MIGSIKWVVVALLLVGVAGAEDNVFFLGLEPAVTKEKDYAKDEFDINIIPLVYQRHLSESTDFRLLTVMNYRFGSAGSISDLGAQFATPWYFRNSKGEAATDPSSGFYIAPVLGLGTNLVDDHNTAVLAFEIGHTFLKENRFGYNVGLQLGGSYFDPVEGDGYWRNHFGIKFHFGRWFN